MSFRTTTVPLIDWPNAARHSTCPNGLNTPTKTQYGIFGNAKRAIIGLV
jgi:hypothetical protein